MLSRLFAYLNPHKAINGDVYSFYKAINTNINIWLISF
ncbi:hypothetical protein PAUR_a3963 [Pseudoalteromonas aurantia 208]|uniref:Uncharacterized protein n=1 Tax=Pseudoalteromonas aurantia 208 TaxID=1314867 RepID=A0ABR9EEU8_9GAMM|nr:hypothetical protein [Pseudoalteromonas aurantia 208]